MNYDSTHLLPVVTKSMATTALATDRPVNKMVCW